ncbi:MAG: WecB/TagA/CpsF family glycosyltransferase [Bryobacteraceae bacterium]|nr:WecB/TagA/CpsF family glycosyltransferase [Bryobacteraceae bacterium]
MTAYRDREFQRVLNSAAIATPDGMPVVWALRSFGARQQARVYGPNLMLSLCERAQDAGLRVYLYGASPETLDSLRQNLLRRCPRLTIAGVHSPPYRALTSAEDAEIVEEIRRARPDIIFVGLSTPKQEFWMSKHQAALPGTVMVGVGAAFDFHAGRLRQAPEWMQRRGLEWLFRLTAEPRRLWRRYLTIVPAFLPLWALQLAGVIRAAEDPQAEMNPVR